MVNADKPRTCVSVDLWTALSCFTWACKLKSPHLPEIFQYMQFIYIIWLAFGIFVKIWIFIVIDLVKLVSHLAEFLHCLFQPSVSLHCFAFGNGIYLDRFIYTEYSWVMTHESWDCPLSNCSGRGCSRTIGKIRIVISITPGLF